MNTNKTQAEQLPQDAVMQSVILPNELRFGIYLKELISNDVFQVEKAFFILLELNLECSRPIPLTEEWLLKFGFKIDETCVSEQNPYLDYIKDEVRISMPYFSFEHGDGAFMELNYVHQLQNLYFSLTARELTVA